MRTTVLVVTICTAMAVWCQQSPASGPSVSDLLAELHSKDWAERSHALDQIRSEPATLRSPKVQVALVDLLDRENRETSESLHVAQEPSHQDAIGSAGEEDGEGYGEYCTWLAETVASFVDWNDPRQACILVNAGYVDYPPSPTKAAARARAAMPCILKRSKSEVALDRAVAGPMLIEAMQKARDTLDAATAQTAKQTILSNLHDPDDGVRSLAVDALGKFGGTDVIPALQQVATTDPSPEVEGHSIRKSATEAIVSIQKRAGQQQQ
jgi:HEAT repeat protein